MTLNYCHAWAHNELTMIVTSILLMESNKIKFSVFTMANLATCSFGTQLVATLVRPKDSNRGRQQCYRSVILRQSVVNLTHAVTLYLFYP